MDNKRNQYLQAMGITVWRSQRKGNSDPLSSSRLNAAEKSETSSVSSITALPNTVEQNENKLTLFGEEDWTDLAQQVAGCTACGLHATRKQTVFGTGSHSASWLVIGEAPGASEDQQGKPFVGRAGQLLTEMLRALGLSRDEVFIANMLKCRPPQNRDPRPVEVDACERFLRQQVDMLKPKIILAAGRIAAQNLLKTDAPLARLRGKVHHYREIPVVVVYHPAYLLRSPLEKRKAWGDLLLARETIEGAGG